MFTHGRGDLVRLDPREPGCAISGGLMDGVDLTRDPRDEGLPSAGSQLVF